MKKGDWEFVEDQLADDQNQMKRQFQLNLLNRGSAAEFKKENSKYPRTVPNGAFKHSFRKKHVERSQDSQRLQINSVANQMNVAENHGARFYRWLLYKTASFFVNYGQFLCTILSIK